MRYAPTLDRLYLGVDESCASCVFDHIRAYAIRPYTCSIEIEANYIATKPSNELQRCWYGSHKTLKWTHSALVRMWQNPQTIRDDAVSGYTKGSNHSVHPQIGLHKRAVAVATMKLRSHSLANAVATIKMLHRSLYHCLRFYPNAPTFFNICSSFDGFVWPVLGVNGMIWRECVNIFGIFINI